MNKVAVIGAGTMGNGIAHTFAQFGHHVSLIDISQDSLDKALNTIGKNLERQVTKERISAEDKQNTLNNLSTFTKIEDGIKGVDLVVEAATENIDIKLQLFKQLDEICAPHVILASNTSSISITKIGSVNSSPDKVICMQFMYPVRIFNLVDIIRGYETSDEVTKIIMEASTKLNKAPVEVNDYPGFIANRILMPMINEAVYSLYEGVAGVEEIDTVMKLGMAHPMGPLQLADFIGLDVCLSILHVLRDGFGNPKYAPCPLLVNMVTAKKLGVKSGEGFYDYSEGTRDLKISASFK